MLGTYNFECPLYIGQPSVTLISSPSSLEGEICSSVAMTCTVQDLSASRWFINGTQEAAYLHSLSNTFPPARELNARSPGISIQIISATIGTSVDTVNATSILTSNVSVLRTFMGQPFECGSNLLRSDPVIIGNITNLGEDDIFSQNCNEVVHDHLGPPPRSTDIECSLSTSIIGGVDILLQWSKSFNTRYRVERYHVTVIPDPSSCSSDHVSTTGDYSCHRLSPETNYAITISAINCGDQEGIDNQFIFYPLVSGRE
jgi:hypothetical protein